MKRKAVMAMLLTALVVGTAVPVDMVSVSAADADDAWDDDEEDDDWDDDWDDDDWDDDDILEEGDGFTASNGYEYEVISINDSKGTGTVMLCGSESERLTSLKVPARVKEEDYTFTVTEIEEEAFEDYSHLKSVTISDTVTLVGEGAFKNCKMLKNVTIGKKVSRIDAKAFFKDKKLSSVKINSTALKKIGSKAFASIDKKCKFKVPASKLKSYKKLLKKAGAGKNTVAAK